MKKILLSIIVSLFTISVFAQKASVEKTIFGIQTGFLGIWGYNEARLSNSFALQSEVGLDAGIWSGIFFEKTGYVLFPVVSLSPKWYYNLKKRAEKGKRIDGNSGNFLSLKTMFHPDLFVISNYQGQHVLTSLAFIPNWGIRRNIGNHFNYELGTGLAFVYYFPDKEYGYSEGSLERGLFVNLRIGYRF